VAAGAPSWVLVGDFNNDGKMDIAVANEPNPNYAPPAPGGPPANSVSILLGNGDGTFRPSIDTPTIGAFTLGAADFNGDGKLDLIVTTGSSVQALLGNGDGTFIVNTLSVTAFGGQVFTGDFNHDGRQDVLVGGWQMLGNGDGTFNFGQSLPLSNVAALGDFNGDGIADLTEVDFIRHSVVGLVAFGLPDGTWSPSSISNFSTDGNLVAADFDGDKKDDVFGAGAPPNGGIDPPVGGLFLSNGDGFFTDAAVGFGFTIDFPDGLGFPAFSAAGDLDKNGSPDVVIAVGTGVLVARNTSGRPPLLAQVTTSTAVVVGGTTLTGTVALGGPAPSGGALIALSSNNVNATFPNGKSILIPAGAQSATFPIATQAVTSSAVVTISATYHSVKQATKFTIVAPFALKSVSVAPSSVIGMFGGDPATGTVTFNGPVTDGTTVSLASAQPGLLSVPVTVSVAAGATTATFPVAAFHVTADTPIKVTASFQGTTATTNVTVQQQPATIVITKAQYTVSKSLLNIEASSNDRVASLQIYNAITGAFVGNIPLVNVGKFVGQLTVTGPFTSVAAQSSVGGVAIAPVAQK
jgi:hypothetical protein